MSRPNVTQPTPKRAKEGLRVVTGCTTRDQFVAVFDRFCDRKTCFIPTVETRPVDSTLAFSLQLADGKPMLRGSGVVRGAWTSFDNAYERPGILVEIKKLSAESVAVYDQLLAKRHAGEQTRPVSVNNDVVPPVVTNRHVRSKQTLPRQRSAHAKPPPIPPDGLRKRSAARGKAAPKSGPMPSIESTTVVAFGPVPIEALPALDSVATVIHTGPIPAEAVRPPPPRVTAATVPSRRSKAASINPLAELDDRTLDAFLNCTMSETAPADVPMLAAADVSMPDQEDTTMVGSEP